MLRYSGGDWSSVIVRVVRVLPSLPGWLGRCAWCVCVTLVSVCVCVTLVSVCVRGVCHPDACVYVVCVGGVTLVSVSTWCVSP